MARDSSKATVVSAAAWTRAVMPYAPPRPAAPITLKLDANEGARTPGWVREVLTGMDLERVRRYPKPREFEELLAVRLGVEASRVLVTAGGDDAIDRACRVALAPGRELVLPVPTFEMIARYSAIAGGTVREVEWSGSEFPVEEALRAMGERTSMVAVVSPNNPTGAVIDGPGLTRVADGAADRNALVLADFAYAEFAEDDLMSTALSRPNVVVVRTFSKAWGMAGLRVGYAVGDPGVIAWLRAAGNPYSVSGPSLAIAREVLQGGASAMRESVARSRRERESIMELLRSCGVEAPASQGNFVFFRCGAADSIRDGLARRGIAVRGFPGDRRLQDALRITVPCDEKDMGVLEGALRETLAESAPRKGDKP